MAELDFQRSAIIDARANKTMWETLAPGAGYISAEMLQLRCDQEKLDWTDDNDVPLHPNPHFVIIHVDCHLIANPATTNTGIEWAMRLRQEPDRFDCPILLLSFQRQDDVQRRDLEYRGGDLLSQFFEQQWQVRWDRLPTTREKLANLVTDARSAFDSEPDRKEKLRGLGQKMCRVLLDQLNRHYRHRQGTFCAAVRLLLGGLQSGIVCPTKGANILAEIERQRGLTPDQSEPRYDFGLVKRYLTLSDAVQAKKKVSAEQVAPKRRMLIIDDEWHSAGWSVVLPALFPEWDVDGCSSYESAVAAALAERHLVLLDFMMPESGLSVLHKIRMQQPLLPVILFTGDDNAATYTSATKWGATGFVLKELADRNDRDSLAYCNYLRNVVNELSAIDSNLLVEFNRGWSKVACRVTPEARKASIRHERLGEAIDAVRRAYFFAAYATGLLGQPADDKNDHIRACARAAGIDLGMALNDICIAHRETLDDLEFSTGNEIVLLFEEGAWAGGSSINTVLRIVRLTNGYRHGIPRVDSAALLNGCRIVADIVRACIDQWRVPVALAAVAVAEPSPTLRTRVPADEAKFGTHESRSQYGCCRYLLGYCIHNRIISEEDHKTLTDLLSYLDNAEPGWGLNYVKDIIQYLKLEPHPSLESAKNLLIIDDTAREDGWLTAFEHSLDGINCMHVAPPILDRTLPDLASEADLVLLDLRLPDSAGVLSEANGLKLLQDIRSRDARCPIVIFSADNEVLWARRAYVSGAQYYFAKSATALPSGFDATQTEFFTEYYLDLRQALQIARMDELVTRMDECRRRLCRNERYAILNSLPDDLRERICRLTRAEPGEPVSEAIGNAVVTEFNLAIGLQWIATEPHSVAAWAYVVGDPESRPYEMLVRFAAFIETLIRIIITTSCPETRWRELKNRTLNPLITEIRDTRYQRLSGIYRSLIELRNRRNDIVHRGAGTTGTDGSFLTVALDVIEVLLNEVALQAAESAAVVAPADTFQVSEQLRQSLQPEKELQRLERHPTRRKAQLWRERRENLHALETQLSKLKTERVEKLAECEKMRGELSAAHAEVERHNELLARQAEMPTRIIDATKYKRDEAICRVESITTTVSRLSSRVAEIDECLADSEPRRARIESDYRMDVQKAQENAAVGFAQKERWQKVDSWLSERRFSEQIAEMTGQPIAPCGWDDDTRKIDDMTNAMIAEDTLDDITDRISKVAEKIWIWAEER